MFASIGEMTPPCGVPASGWCIHPSSSTPAFSHLSIARRTTPSRISRSRKTLRWPCSIVSKERLDVDLHHPAAAHIHQSTPERIERLVCRATTTEAVRAVEKLLLVDGLESHRHRTLQHLVLERRDTDGPGLSSALRDVYAAHGRRAIRAGHE